MTINMLPTPVRAVFTVREIQDGDTGPVAGHVLVAEFGWPELALARIEGAKAFAGPLRDYTGPTFATALVTELMAGAAGVALVQTYAHHDATWRYEVTRAKYNDQIIVRVFWGCEGSTKRGVRNGWFEVFYGRLKDAIAVVDQIDAAGPQYVRVKAPPYVPSARAV